MIEHEKAIDRQDGEIAALRSQNSNLDTYLTAPEQLLERSLNK
jgi:hypothetical protein